MPVESVHIPVLLKEVINSLTIRDCGRYLDGTLGLAGHAEAILHQAKNVELCGLDRDSQALSLAGKRLEQYSAQTHLFKLSYSNFAQALKQLDWRYVDGAILDLGVSSLQLDMAPRGFSFLTDAPLDMRMDQKSCELSARDWVNGKSYDELVKCIAEYGEDPMAPRIARAIIEARRNASIERTVELASIIVRAYPPNWRAKSRRHPATRTFQALRMAVNDELGELQSFLEQIMSYLPLGGRLSIISFHSLEDRIVKRMFHKWAEGCRCPRNVGICTCGHRPEVRLLNKKPLEASEIELKQNPRARSAKLRTLEKIWQAAS